MNFATSISTCMSKYATFSGRASRSEYWWLYLFVLLMSWGATIVGSSMFGVGDPMKNILSFLVNLVFLLPTLSSACRRLHDTGRSGWWMLISFTIIGLIPLVIWFASNTKPAGDKYEV